VYELASRLDKSRFTVEVIALCGGEVAGWLRRAGIEVTVLGVRGKWDAIKLFRLARLLRTRQIDLLHTHLFHADLAGRFAAILAGVDHVIHTVHVAEGRARPWQFAFARLMQRFCDRIVCVSQNVMDFHRRKTGIKRSLYKVIHNGVDINAYSRDADARKRIRDNWQLAEDDFLAAFVGRLDYQKGISTLLEAITQLAEKGSPVNIVLAGAGPQRKAVENHIASAPGGSLCRLLGFTNDIRSVLSAADALVMPSRWEGFGLSALEALAAGLPVIATSVPGLREVVINNVTGILINPDDPAALAAAIQTLRQNPEIRKSLGKAGASRALCTFSIEKNIRAHEKLYADILG